METWLERQSVGNSGPLNKSLTFYTLVNLPIELLVYIISFVTCTRDKVKLRYVSQRLRIAAETPSLWREFIWPHYDFREEHPINIVLQLCGSHMKRLSFPDMVIPVESLQHCDNLLQLSLPSVKLSLDQIKTMIQYMTKLQCLDILLASKTDIKSLLQMVNSTIKELTIRERIMDSSFEEVLHLLLNEWTALQLFPNTINIVTVVSSELIRKALDKWVDFETSASKDYIGYLNLYRSYMGLVPTKPPNFQCQIIGPHDLKDLFVNVSNYGLLGLESDHLLLTSCTGSNGDVLHKGTMKKNIHGTPLNIISIKFLTHFSTANCDFFYSGHLEQLAIACPNLRQLKLQKNVNCLKNLQGLRAIATSCRKLEGLNIVDISVNEVENCLQLWEILVCLQLTYLAIDWCCLIPEGDDQTVIGLHQKCLKMKSLLSHSNCFDCGKCIKNRRTLLLSNFKMLFHCSISYIDDLNISESLRCLWYSGITTIFQWPRSMTHCNLQEVYIDLYTLSFSFMKKISAHGGLVHVILNVRHLSLNVVTILIKNSPNLITFHVYTQFETDWFVSFDPKDFISTLEKKFSQRKLFLCGSFRLVNGILHPKELDDLLINVNINFFSVWRNAFY